MDVPGREDMTPKDGTMTRSPKAGTNDHIPKADTAHLLSVGFTVKHNIDVRPCVASHLQCVVNTYKR